MILPFILLAGGGAVLLAVALSQGDDPPVPVHEPDMPAAPGSTRYKLVDAILPELTKAAQASGIPLGLLVGWIAKESGGKLSDTTSLDERGYFQLMPSESKRLGLDHQRLSTDSVYSINAGLLLIALYMKEVDALGVAPKGSAYYWRLVKLGHSMGTGAMDKIVKEAQSNGAAGTWQALEGYAIDNNSHFLSLVKHAPAKWFPFVDAVYNVGKPFGFGTDATTVVGAAVYTDIVDPLDCLQAKKA